MNTVQLSKYGKVEQFEEKDNRLYIKITDGFSNNVNPTFELMGKICKNYPQYPLVEKMVTDSNLFHLILNKKQ